MLLRSGGGATGRPVPQEFLRIVSATDTDAYVIQIAGKAQPGSIRAAQSPAQQERQEDTHHQNSQHGQHPIPCQTFPDQSPECQLAVWHDGPLQEPPSASDENELIALIFWPLSARIARIAPERCPSGLRCQSRKLVWC